MNVIRTTEPAIEPITLDEAKAHLRIVDFTDDDTYIQSLISVARRAVEDMTGHPLIDTVFLQTAREWRTSIGLLRGNGHTIASVKYDDVDGIEQTVDPSLYSIYPYGDGCAACVFFDEFTEPDLVDRPFVDRIRIQFTAGYGAAASAVPEAIKQAIMIMVADLYELRTSHVVGASVAHMDTIQSLCGPYKIYN